MLACCVDIGRCCPYVSGDRVTVCKIMERPSSLSRSIEQIRRSEPRNQNLPGGSWLDELTHAVVRRGEIQLTQPARSINEETWQDWELGVHFEVKNV